MSLLDLNECLSTLQKGVHKFVKNLKVLTETCEAAIYQGRNCVSQIVHVLIFSEIIGSI